MIVGIYLAAGKSTRMGSEKLHLPLVNKHLGTLALETAIQSNLDRVVVVTKEVDSLSWLPTNLQSEKWILSRCNGASKGQSESIKCGLKSAQKLKATAVMILLADQPFVSKRIIDHLITHYKKEKPSFVASCHKGIVRPPVIFDASQFPALFKLKGDGGAKQILRGIKQGLTINFIEERSFIDADTPEQYEVLKNLLK